MEKGRSEQHQAPKGYVPVLVGRPAEKEMERFLVRIKKLRHPCLVLLLEMGAEEFGYQQKGVLRIPCDVQHFREVLEVVSKDM